MEKTRRRFWTFAISAAAGVVILAGAASGLFQIAVQAVPGYRQEVESKLRAAAGRPIRIDAIALTWRYYYPGLDLSGATLLSESGAPLLQARRVRLGFGLLDLMRGSRLPDRIEIEGLQLDVRIARDGTVRIHGLPPLTAGAGDGGGESLERFAQLRLTDVQLNLRDDRRGPQAWAFDIVSARLDRTLLGHRLRANVGLPPLLGGGLQLDASFGGPLAAPAAWRGRFELELESLAAAPLLERVLQRGVELQAVRLGAELEGDFADGALTVVHAHVGSGPLTARRGDHRAAIEGFDLRASAAPLEGRWQKGWRADIRSLEVEGSSGAWPESRGAVELRRGEAGVETWDVKLSFLRIGDLAPWLPLADAPAALAALGGAQGEVEDLQVQRESGTGEPRYGFRARFTGLGMPAAPVGVAGLRGEVAGDETGGRAVFQRSSPVLELPGKLLSPSVPLEEFEAEAEWRRGESGWRLALPQFRWAVWGLRGKGELAIDVPREPGRSTVLDLHASFLAEDVTRAKSLMPMSWGAGLRGWLDRAILSGRVPRAELVIRGPVDAMPFKDPATGTFALDIEAEGIDLAFLPDWPAIEGIAASLAFRGNALEVKAASARLGAARVRQASARFPDFSTAQLLVDGQVDGDLAELYAVANDAPPLRELLRPLLASSRARGPASVDLHLDIPLKESRGLAVTGAVRVDGGELDHEAVPAPIRDIRGAIEFGGPGLRAESLTARIWELPLGAAIVPQPSGGSLLAADLVIPIDAAGRGASALIPAFIRSRVAGSARWRAALPIGAGQAPVLTLRSDLTGVEVKVPAPLGKPADEARPLVLAIGGSGAPLRITAEYQDRLGADLRFARGAALALERGTLRLGTGPLIEPAEPGLVLGGQIETLDLEAWMKEFDRAGSPSAGGELVRRADLHVGSLRWRHWAARDARYQWAAQPAGAWVLGLIGAGAVGDLRWSPASGGTLRARLEQLTLDLLPVTADGGDAPADPTRLPVLDLEVKRLQVGSTDFGRVVLATARTEAGQRLRTFRAEGGTLDAKAEGEWRRRAGQSSGSLQAQADTRDPEGLFRAFAYTPNITAKSAKLAGDLRWAPAGGGLDWQDARGTVHLEFENGQLRQVEPGAGRVLGLFNFYALPRRLSLNFKDVVGSGLAFDTVSGDFALGDGNARTDNVQLKAPSLRMELRGRVGLRARDYDQEVRVYPGVSSGVTIGATLLGGPIAGALALIAQQILDKPLDQVTQLSYRITGSWDNPQVERAGGDDSAVPERVPGSPSQK